MPQTLPALVGFFVILTVCAATAFVGGSRERIGALAFLLAVFVSAEIRQASLVHDPVKPLMAVDVVLLVVFGALAWRPQKGWPVWAVGAQGLIVAIDGLRLAEPGIKATTYLAALNVATCALTVVIAYAGWAAWRRRQV